MPLLFPLRMSLLHCAVCSYYKKNLNMLSSRNGAHASLCSKGLNFRASSVDERFEIKIITLSLVTLLKAHIYPRVVVSVSHGFDLIILNNMFHLARFLSCTCGQHALIALSVDSPVSVKTSVNCNFDFFNEFSLT